MNIVHLIDCMEFMRGVPDGHYSLAIVDPPYGIGADKGRSGAGGFRGTGQKIQRRQYESEWDSSTPSKEFFDELLRISNNQIIWGANFFTSMIPQNGHWVFWDKENTMPTFSDGELAWTSFDRSSVKKVTVNNNGLLAKERDRIHPTQKPVALYKWLLANYAKEGDTIFDSHVGSGSIRIACHDLGFDFEGCEIDPDYWQAQEDRYKEHVSQPALFEAPLTSYKQRDMF